MGRNEIGVVMCVLTCSHFD